MRGSKQKGIVNIATVFLFVGLFSIGLFGLSAAGAGAAILFSHKGEPNSGTFSENSGGGCYLQDSAFSDTTSIASVEQVLLKLGPAYPILNDKKNQLQTMITESVNKGINPALLIGMWSGEQSFKNDDAALGCGIFAGSTNRYVGFGNQVSCALDKVDKAMKNTAPYNKPAGANIFTRLFYTYTGAMKAVYDSKGYVADESNPRIKILQILVPNEVTCLAPSTVQPSGNFCGLQDVDQAYITFSSAHSQPKLMPAATSQFNLLAKDFYDQTNTKIGITSMFRTYQDQVAISNDPSSIGPAPAGYSPHEAGLAFDIDLRGICNGKRTNCSTYMTFKSVAEKYGWQPLSNVCTDSSECHHFYYRNGWQHFNSTRYGSAPPGGIDAAEGKNCS